MRILIIRATSLSIALFLTIATGIAQLHHFLVEAAGGGAIPSQVSGTQFFIQVLAKDSINNTVTGFNGTVAIASTGSLLSGGGPTAPFVNGILSSHGVVISNTGSFTITATNTAGAQSGTSNSFSVDPGAAANLLFIQQPTSTTPGAGVDPPVTVQLLDNFENPVETPNILITVSLSSGTGTLSGTLTQSTDASGIATFDDLHLNLAGSKTLTASSPGLHSVESNTFTINNITLRLRIMLEGPFSGGSMNTLLRTNNLLPHIQPYTSSPWNYAGTESSAATPANVVDWILVELRNGTNAASTIGRRAAWVTSSGTVIDVTDPNRVVFPNVPAGNYFIVIKHRNHLAVMSSTQVAVSDTSALFDFTAGLSRYFGGEAKQLAGGLFGMYAGDYSTDNFIDGSDFVGPDNERFLGGYRRSDVNMDGFIDGSDFIGPDNNKFKGTHVPN